MRWKSVVWVSGLLPVLTGCTAVHNLTTETCLVHTQCAIEHDLRKDAHRAWQCVRQEHPRRAFTAEFHDGFLDGFVDYLDRGGNAQPPAVPPIKYVRNKKYFTPEGHCLINDYYLGFKYGTDVAVASGKRQYLTVPVLLADASCAITEVPASAGSPTIPYIPTSPNTPSPNPQSPPRPMPLPSPQPIPDHGKFGEPTKKNGPVSIPADTGNSGVVKLPKPEVPVIKPFNPPLPDDMLPGNKFKPLPNPDLLPIPEPPLPIPNVQTEPLPVLPDEPRRPVPPTLEPIPVPMPSSLKVTLPAPPDAVPTLPPSVPTPSILDVIPVVPFQPATPAPIPVTNLFPRK